MAAWNSSQPRIEALRARWDRDPSSRLSLQLAEEYRRSGDLDQALHVLRKGIETTPSIAAEVALGRCLLEANDVAAAKVHLGRAIERDPTQMVAYRHLIEAHTRLGDRAEAAAALDIYRQLNPTDPDLDDLATRLDGAAPPGDEGPTSSSDRIEVDDGETSTPLAASELPPIPPPAEEASPSAVETATFRPLDGAQIVGGERLAAMNEANDAVEFTKATEAPETPTSHGTAASRGATPFVSFLDRTEDETPTGRETQAPEPDLGRSADAPSRFGFAGAWPEADERAEETVPFFEPGSPVFRAPQGGAIRDAVVLDSGDLFSLEHVERDPFDLFSLPSRPLRRPRRTVGVSTEPTTPRTEASVQVPTETLSRLYREQGHQEEADQLERQIQGETERATVAAPALKAVDFAPLRQLQAAQGASRRRLVVAGYLDRLTEGRDVS